MKFKAFTLAELLIALAILGVIATFTIPKVLTSQQNNTFNSAAKEAASMLSGAYVAYQQAGNAASSATGIYDLTPYMNYVSIYTLQIDDAQTDNQLVCGTASYTCLKLHSGGVIAYRANASFGGTADINGLPFFYDPDGVYGGTTNGPGKSICIFLFFNGRLSDRASIPAGTMNSAASYGSAPSKNPPWFNWN